MNSGQSLIIFKTKSNSSFFLKKRILVLLLCFDDLFLIKFKFKFIAHCCVWSLLIIPNWTVKLRL